VAWVADLVLIGLGIALQPFRLSAFILILSTENGNRKGLGFILGWLACLVLVIAVVTLITGDRPVHFRTVSGTVAAIAKLALGVALIVIAAMESRRSGRPRILTAVLARLDTMSPWTAALVGAIVQPWTLVAAGAVTATQARPSSVEDYLALASFCLLATSSFAVLELWSVLAPSVARTRLAELRAWLDKHGKQIIVVICLAVGLWLAGESIHQLAIGGRTAHHVAGVAPGPALRCLLWPAPTGCGHPVAGALSPSAPAAPASAGS
jgi:hypothetical protein